MMGIQRCEGLNEAGKSMQVGEHAITVQTLVSVNTLYECACFFPANFYYIQIITHYWVTKKNSFNWVFFVCVIMRDVT